MAAVQTLVRSRMPAKKRWKAAPYTHPINGGAGTVDGISVGYDIVAGTASVFADSRGRIVTTIPVRYSVWARYRPVSGAPAMDASCVGRSASLVLTTDISIRRSKVVAKTRASVTAQSRCVITRLRIDITDLLTGFVGTRLDQLAAKIDRKVADAFDVAGSAAVVWRTLREPRAVSGGWLDLDPRAIQISPLAVRNGSLRARLQIISRPALRVDKPASRTTEMPSIDTHSSPGSVSVVVEAALDYSALDRATLPLVLRPRGREIAIGLDLSRGRAWAVGEIAGVNDRGALAIRALRWTADSRSVLDRPAARLASLEKKLAGLEIGELANLRARAQDGLNEGLGAVPLLAGAVAIDAVRFASAKRTRRGARLFFRASGQAVDPGGCMIRRGAAITRATVSCTRAAVARFCKRPCDYAADGKTWLPAR